MPATIPLLQEGRYSIEHEFPYLENCLIFQAYDTKTEAPVTIVEVPVRPSASAAAAQREAINSSFSEQAAALARFKHRSVVAIRSHFSESGRNYVVSDPIDGIDLASVLKDQNGPFTVSQISRWADTILDALNVMHNSRPALIYHNLHLENVVLRSDGSVDLLAAGMLHFDDRSVMDSGGPALAYSPLEQIWPGLDAASQKVIISKYDETSERVLKQGLDARSDLFSLGATLYKLVTGETPVDALERSIEMIEGNPDPLKSPNSVVQTVPVEVSDVIMKALEIRREYRFDSAAIMRQVLKTTLVRVTEREAEEALVQKVEGHDVRPAVQNGPVPDSRRIESKPSTAPPPASAERPIDAGLPPLIVDRGQHGSDIGETRHSAEILEDDVLGILSPSAHVSEPPQARQSSAPFRSVVEKAKIESPPSAVLTKGGVETVSLGKNSANEPVPLAPVESAVPKEASAPGGQPASERSNDFDADPNVEPKASPAPAESVKASTPPAAEQAKAATAFSSADNDVMFAESGNRRGIGLPAIAAVIVVLCVAAVGGWFYFGPKPTPSASAEAPAAATQPSQADPSVQAGAQPAESPAAEITTIPEEQPIPSEQPEVEQVTNPDQVQPQKVASAEPRAKRPAAAPAKTPTPKKVVTVDDLINDN